MNCRVQVHLFESENISAKLWVNLYTKAKKPNLYHRVILQWNSTPNNSYTPLTVN